MGAADLFTLSDIATQVAQTYGSTDTTTLTKVKKWVNRAIIDITNFGEWPFLKDGDETFATVASTSEYTMVCTIKEIKKLYYKDSNDYNLVAVDYDKWISVINDDADASGTPTHYTIVGWDQYTHGWKIRLWPQPSSAITIYVSADKYIPLFDSDKDDLRDRMPETMLNTLIAIAEKYALKDLDDITEQTRILEVDKILREAHARHNRQRNIRHCARPFEPYDVDRAYDPILPPNYS